MNVSSVTQVNSIRPMALASLHPRGEAQMTHLPDGSGLSCRKAVERGKLDDQKSNAASRGSGVVGDRRDRRFTT